ncbi:hypothetical protein KY312_03795 [Candidatus Woesearchaeota archaeon]|nr:hypothetical protein [Candidatus Woesearchaeota archaeon]
MKTGKRGQVATELVTTYGFMILAITIIIAGLAYFGVLDVTRLLPKKCTLPAGLACIDQEAYPSNISLALLNSLGYDIYVLNISLTQCDLLNPGLLESNKMQVYHLDCYDLIEGRYKTNIELSFRRKDTNLAQRWVGELITRIPSNGTYY